MTTINKKDYRRGMSLLYEYAPIISASKYTKANPYIITLPSEDGTPREYHVTNSSYKTFASVIVRNFNAASKGRQVSTVKRGIGFDRPAVFDAKVVDYFSRTLTSFVEDDSAVLPSFSRFVPGTTTPNPTYRVIRHSSMTKVFDLCSKINNLAIPDIPNVVYQGDDEFKTVFADAINAAKEKDHAKGREDADAATLRKSFEASKKLKGYMFNPDFFTHAQQSKIIETSKADIVVIDELSELDNPEVYKKMQDRARQLKEEGRRTVLVSHLNQKAADVGLLAAYGVENLYELWDKQAETLNNIRTQFHA